MMQHVHHDPVLSACGTDRQFAAVQQLRRQCDGRADEEWTQFKRRS